MFAILFQFVNHILLVWPSWST